MEIKDLSIRYGDVSILKNINVKFEPGSINHIIGSNGSGKSSFFKSLSMTSNKKINFNFDVNDISIISDYVRIPNEVKVCDVIKLVKSNDKMDKDMVELYEICDINKNLNKRIKFLSTGEKRKLEIFLALLKRKKILICDEATNGLDAMAKQNFIQFIREIILNYKDITILYTTHDLNEIFALKGKYFGIDKMEKSINTIEYINDENLKKEILEYIL